MTTDMHVTLSIVSHGQGAIIRNLLEDCHTFTGVSFEIVLTLNIPEDHGFYAGFTDLPIRVIENNRPQGFGANHNAAFQASRAAIFMIVNPDIRAPGLDLSSLATLAAVPGVGACAPLVLGAGGQVEDSARRFPTIARLLARVLLRWREADYDLSGKSSVTVDWVAGMFVAFARATYQTVGGFDDRFFMYMEDADICRRLRKHGLEILVDCSTSVVHDARRASRRSLKHLSWHARSAVRFIVGV